MLTARIQGATESARSELDKAHARLGECERYLEIAPGWAQGCEMEASYLALRLVELASMEPVPAAPDGRASP